MERTLCGNIPKFINLFIGEGGRGIRGGQRGIDHMPSLGFHCLPSTFIRIFLSTLGEVQEGDRASRGLVACLREAWGHDSSKRMVAKQKKICVCFRDGS